MMRERLVEAAEEVFDELGSGWSESIYHKALIRELSERKIPHYTEGSLSVMYKGGSVGTRRPDLMVHSEGESIIVELKAGSNRGSDQLRQYLDMAKESQDLRGSVSGGALIKFNNELEYVFIGFDQQKDDRKESSE